MGRDGMGTGNPFRRKDGAMGRIATVESLLSRVFPFLVGLPFFVNVMGAGLIRMGKVRSVSYHESGQTLPVGLFVVVLFSFFLVLRSLAVGAIRSRVSDCGA